MTSDRAALLACPIPLVLGAGPPARGAEARPVDFHVAPMGSPTQGPLLTGGVHDPTVRRLD